MPVNVSGVVVSVRLPKGKAGDAFIFEVNQETWEAARSNPSCVEGQQRPLHAELIRRRRTLARRVAHLFSSCTCIACDKKQYGHFTDIGVAV